jgi:hypothetical protein
VDDISVISGFITPGSDRPPPRALDASITVDVLDPTENNEPFRIVETDTPFDVTVTWCICGPFAAMQAGCWYVKVFIDDIDGVGPTHGRLASARVDGQSAAVVVLNDTSQRCYEHTFNFQAGAVAAGVYRLVVIVTFASGSCETPGPLIRDMLGYAEIPVLMFWDEDDQD